MFILHLKVRGISLGLHITDDFGFAQDLAFCFNGIAGATVEWLSRDEADRA